jgi:hypothetical protein
MIFVPVLRALILNARPFDRRWVVAGQSPAGEVAAAQVVFPAMTAMGAQVLGAAADLEEEGLVLVPFQAQTSVRSGQPFAHTFELARLKR